MIWPSTLQYFVSSCISEHKSEGRYASVSRVTDRRGLFDFETSRLLYFVDNRLTDGDEVVSLTRRSHL
jgi:hypothetical protein